MILKYERIAEDIVGSALEVYGVLGYEFLEKVYLRALQAEVLRRGHKAELEHSLKLRYRGAIAGECAADLLVDGKS